MTKNILVNKNQTGLIKLGYTVETVICRYCRLLELRVINNKLPVNYDTFWSTSYESQSKFSFV